MKPETAPKFVYAKFRLSKFYKISAFRRGTVLAAKEFIDGELAKYESWDLAPLYIKELIGTEPAFRNVKARGSGGETILAFLGGNWKQWMIQEALVIPYAMMAICLYI